MCGIAGIAGAGAEHQLAVLTRMSERIAHRGPDDSGEWTAPGVAMAHRRLSIIDLSPDGHQPMVSDCGRFTLTFNGEIYNYRELRDELSGLGDRFRSHSDTEVLLMALRRWGASALARCNGMWAFALWDCQTQSLLAARDRFGEKPFYYTVYDGRLYFASEVKALLAIPGFSTRPDPAAVADFAVERISGHREQTFYSGIRQLLPASLLRWKDGRVSTSTYWKLPVEERGYYRRSDIEEIRDGFARAVDLRLRADTPMGCLLSGGLDSSAVMCFSQLSQSGTRPLHIFSTVHQPPEVEARGIDDVRAKFPSLHFDPDMPGEEQFWHDLPDVLKHQESPFGDASMVAHFGLMRCARQAGVPVLLSGQGADEVFAGYPGYLWVYMGSRLRTGNLSQFLRFWLEARRLHDIPLSSIALYAMPSSLGAMAKKGLGGQQLYWLSKEFRTTSDGITQASTEHSRADPLDQALLQSIGTRTLPGFLHYEDRNSMAFGVETRLPFLDHRLVELLFRQPPDTKVEGGWTKRLLREAAAGVVPDSIRLRPEKTGYPAPLQAWLRARPAEFMESAQVRDCPLLDVSVWEALAKRFLAGDDVLLSPTWRGYILSRWYATFFGREAL